MRDWDKLLAAAPPGAKLLLLEPNGNGLEQISAHLRRWPESGYHGLAIVAEATAARLALGSGALDDAALRQQGSLLRQWRKALAPGAGLRLYGCRLAAGATGRRLLHSLAELTGLPVAASAQPVGPPVLGGRTSLELCTAPLPAAPAWLEAALGQRLGHVLDTGSPAPEWFGEEVQTAAMHAGDSAFREPIEGQLRLPSGICLDMAALILDHDATEDPELPGAWVISTDQGTFRFWSDGHWSYGSHATPLDPAIDWNDRGDNNASIGAD